MKKLLALAIVAACAVPAFAQDAGPYIGVDVASTKISGLGSATGLGATFGYQINKNFAAELALRNLGSYNVGTIAGLGGVNVKYSAAQISAVGIMPFSDAMSGYLRLGYGNNRTKVSIAGYKAADTGSSALFGAGLQFNLNKQASLRVEYTRLGSNASQFGLGGLYRF